MKIFKISGIFNGETIRKSIKAEDKPKAIAQFINECVKMKQGLQQDCFTLTRIVEEGKDGVQGII